MMKNIDDLVQLMMYLYELLGKIFEEESFTWTKLGFNLVMKVN